jgi:hypothetical protein
MVSLLRDTGHRVDFAPRSCDGRLAQGEQYVVLGAGILLTSHDGIM